MFHEKVKPYTDNGPVTLASKAAGAAPYAPKFLYRFAMLKCDWRILTRASYWVRSSSVMSTPISFTSVLIHGEVTGIVGSGRTVGTVVLALGLGTACLGTAGSAGVGRVATAELCRNADAGVTVRAGGRTTGAVKLSRRTIVR